MMNVKLLFVLILLYFVTLNIAVTVTVTTKDVTESKKDSTTQRNLIKILETRFRSKNETRIRHRRHRSRRRSKSSRDQLNYSSNLIPTSFPNLWPTPSSGNNLPRDPSVSIGSSSNNNNDIVINALSPIWQEHSSRLDATRRGTDQLRDKYKTLLLKMKRTPSPSTSSTTTTLEHLIFPTTSSPSFCKGGDPICKKRMTSPTPPTITPNSFPISSTPKTQVIFSSYTPFPPYVSSYAFVPYMYYPYYNYVFICPYYYMHPIYPNKTYYWPLQIQDINYTQ